MIIYDQEVKLPRTKRKERDFNMDPRLQKEVSNNLIQIKPYLKRNREVNIIPRNLSQETYLELLKNPKKYIVFAIGP